MSTELIELKGGLLVEVQARPEDEPRQVSASAADLVDGAIEDARDLLLKAVQPVASVWGELNRDLTIEEVQIELALGFEVSGKLFIAQAGGNGSLKFRLTVKPSPPQD